jgi:DNA-binding MarR family transcriptional regulator
VVQTDPKQQSATAVVADLANHLRPVILKLSRHLRREAQKVGVSALDAQLLGVVKLSPGVGVSDLAELEQMSRPAMSAHVKRLEAAGWLVRRIEAPDDDKRRARLVLTPKGAQALSAIRRSRNDWLAARLAGLTAAEQAALETAIGPLSRLVESRLVEQKT